MPLLTSSGMELAKNCWAAIMIINCCWTATWRLLTRSDAATVKDLLNSSLNFWTVAESPYLTRSDMDMAKNCWAAIMIINCCWTATWPLLTRSGAATVKELLISNLINWCWRATSPLGNGSALLNSNMTNNNDHCKPKAEQPCLPSQSAQLPRQQKFLLLLDSDTALWLIKMGQWLGCCPATGSMCLGHWHVFWNILKNLRVLCLRTYLHLRKFWNKKYLTNHLWQILEEKTA